MKEEFSRTSVDEPSPAKRLRQNYSLLDWCPAVTTETDLLGCSSPRAAAWYRCVGQPINTQISASMSEAEHQEIGIKRLYNAPITHY